MQEKPGADRLDPKQLLAALSAAQDGNFTVRMPIGETGVTGRIYDAFNQLVTRNQQMCLELARIRQVVGKEGRIRQRAGIAGAGGGWSESVEALNSLITDLAYPTAEVARVIGAVASGDLSQKMELEADGEPLRGEFLRTGRVVNRMVDQLSSFASEVTRVAREVGTEGKLGGQAQVKGVSGTWKDLTDSVNSMASNLTWQVRNIAEVTTAVAKGDLSKKITVDVKGEILELKDTVNTMVDQLRSFASEVTRVAREVGTQGELGGQAVVEGVAGTWKDLTDNVNQLADNLTTQVRAIAEVATAVTKGDLTRSIKVQAQGEVAELKDNINQMIANLRETTQKNAEQDWLKSNLARFTGMLQGQRDLHTVADLILSELAPLVGAYQGAFYLANESTAVPPRLHLLAGYACHRDIPVTIPFGEGLVGQCAVERKRILISNAPPDYLRISSSLGEATPLSIAVLPVRFEQQIKAVIELAALGPLSRNQLAFLDLLTENIGIVLNTIAASMRTEELLKQSQGLTEELQNTNEELAKRSDLLQQQKAEVEHKNQEIELAKAALEERAQQLALASRYKSEFLANMSHELRTPLNSLLILARLLSENREGNLSDKQVEFARTIYSGGTDLLLLINDILDLSKIESGTMAVAIDEVDLSAMLEFCERTFRQVAQANALEFEIVAAPDLLRTIHTDPRRVQQVLKNLLSNAFKFTDQGKVVLEVAVARSGWSPENQVLGNADQVIAFSVSDTGIGIPADKQRIIFEAFQQADGSASRRYGGTGLGLSISREIARLLGADLTVTSEPGRGSVFTLYVPRVYVAGNLAAGTWAIEGEMASVGAGAGVASGRGASDKLPAPMSQSADELRDDRNQLRTGDRVILVIASHVQLARQLVDAVRARGFKALAALGGGDGLSLARTYRPEAIALDLDAPMVDGWTFFDRLKHDDRTMHVPILLAAGPEVDRREARARGAFSMLRKPADVAQIDAALERLIAFLDRPRRRLLLCEPDQTERRAIEALLEGDDLEITSAATAERCLALLSEASWDLLILDPALPDRNGVDLLTALEAHPGLVDTPILLYGAHRLGNGKRASWDRAALILKQVRAVEDLFSEASLLLHRPEEGDRRASNPELIATLPELDPILIGNKVLVVDDDVRNIFAVTSMLERHGAVALHAENGRRAIDVLEANPDVDMVLMDIMMPEMDGYQTTREIRRLPQFSTLPIIALTAKAMKGDREKCLAAGASDYIAKPAEVDQLIGMIRSWLYRRQSSLHSDTALPVIDDRR